MNNLLFLTLWLSVTMGFVAVAGRRLWRLGSPSSRIYLALSWALVSIGFIQVALAPLKFTRFDETALWFATAGMAVILTGTMNLLNLGRALTDTGVRRVCLVANLAMTAVFVLVATHRGTETPHDPVSIALMAVGALAIVLGSGIRQAAAAGQGGNDFR